MIVRLLGWWDSLRSSFWFLPGLMIAGGLAMGVAFPMLDEAINEKTFENWPWFQITPEAGRATLAAIAGAMFTVTGVVFSITLVTVSVATSQFGSRLLRTFAADNVPQISIGLLLATSLYCLVVLRRVGASDAGLLTPNLSVYVGVIGAIASMGVLIFLIHHIAQLVQAPHIVALVAGDIDRALERLFPESLKNADFDQESPAPTDAETVQRRLAALEEPGGRIRAARDGYVEAVHLGGLMEAAKKHDVVLRLELRPGDFAIAGAVLATVWPAEGAEAAEDDVRGAVLIGLRRTSQQDVICPIEDMVEIAVRALSPGINAPFTAIACIDRLAAALGKLAQRRIPSPYRFDRGGCLRVIAPSVDFPQALEAAFRQIHYYGRNDLSINVRLLDALAVIGALADRQGDRQALLQFAERIQRNCDAGLDDGDDQQTLRRRSREVIAQLRANEATPDTTAARPPAAESRV
ncbi:MAG: DUF2254 domain-containing protein [Planctomycetes bacterium]|nr:DUF2254 domain-containing protein [Planctomycetota bacterium]